MPEKEMLAIKRGYDFAKWLLNHTGKFPKSHRFNKMTSSKKFSSLSKEETALPLRAAKQRWLSGCAFRSKPWCV